MNLKDKLFTEKYRPKRIDDYVFVDDRQRNQVMSWIADGSIPNLLFSGEAGTGKTTLAKVLINELKVEEYDVLEVNASRENGVDVIRDKILSFVQTMPFGQFKVVLLDEADYLTAPGQAMLRSDIETYSSSVRFILTCNYEHKIIPALKSRCHILHINKTDRTEFMARAATVLLSENIQFDLDVLEAYITANYPDLRKTLNALQVNSTTGVLLACESTVAEQHQLLVDAAESFSGGKIAEGRQLMLQYLDLYPSRVQDIYKWMYENLNLWGGTDEKRDAAIVVIRNGLANLSLVGIPEISLAATLVELTTL